MIIFEGEDFWVNFWFVSFRQQNAFNENFLASLQDLALCFSVKPTLLTPITNIMLIKSISLLTCPFLLLHRKILCMSFL